MNALPRNTRLEAQIAENRDDMTARSVYADWLQGEGHVYGEFIALQIANQAFDRQQQLLEALELPDAPELADLTWKNGFITSMRIENEDWMGGQHDVRAWARAWFGSPVCLVLDTLRIGVLDWDHNHQLVPAVLDEAAQHPFAAGLTTLHLGDVDSDIDMAHHVIGAVGKRISRAFPMLTHLTLHSGEQSYNGPATFEIEGLDLPRLETLTIETCAMSQARLQHLFDANLPRVRALELWFGDSEDYGADCTIDDLEPLLCGERFAGVTELGLRNAGFTNDLCARLPHSPIAARLTHLDLSLGTLDRAGVEALLPHADAFPALERLVLDQNFVTEQDAAELQAAFAGVELTWETWKEVDPNDPDWRYVSVYE